MSRRRGGVALPSLGAGAGLALSLPPWGWWPLAFAGAALLYWRLAGLRARGRLLAGWLAGLGCFGPGLFSFQKFNWYGAAALVAVEALSMAVAALVVPGHRGRVGAFTGAFTVLEAARMAFPFGGLPIGGVFLGQAGGPLLGLARLGGPLLLTAAVFLGGAGLAELVLALRRPGAPAATGGGRWMVPRPRSLATGAGALAAVVVLGTLGAAATDGGPPVRTLHVAAVQGGGGRGFSAAQVDPARVFAAQRSATSVLVTHPRRPLDLVVWPEDVISLPGPLAGSPAAATMAGLARQLRATVVAGVTETLSATAFRNRIVAWGPGGQVVASYQKVHRVPFGEYVPLRGFFAHFAGLQAVPLDEVAGHGSGLMTTPAGPLGALDSYEVFYADRGRSAVRAGARLLVVPTNTSSYASGQVPDQEVAADRVQAVAEGRDLVQAAPTGYSTVVDHRGDVRAQTVLGRRQVLRSTVELRAGATVYERFGDLPVLVLALGALGLGWLFEARWRRRPTGTAPDDVPAPDVGVRGPGGRRPVTPPRCPPGPASFVGTRIAGPRHRRAPHASVVVPRVDVDAGDALGHEHGVVGGVVLEGEAEVEAVGPQVLDHAPFERGDL